MYTYLLNLYYFFKPYLFSISTYLVIIDKIPNLIKNKNQAILLVLYKILDVQTVSYNQNNKITNVYNCVKLESSVFSNYQCLLF